MGCIVKDENLRWDGPIIPFMIDPNLTNLYRVFQAMAAWETVTGVRFVARDAQEDHIYVRHGQDACNSSVGRLGGRQFVNLQPGCSAGPSCTSWATR
jgi:Astacin (Peptidase family M12A)